MPAADYLAAGTAHLEIRTVPSYGPHTVQARQAGNELDLGAVGPKIIERPRLTRLLDEATARVLMLVAPAGYGKTTLARQWLAKRNHGWYRGTIASSDVAALAVGLAEAAGAVVPNAGRRMRDRLKAASTPEADVVPLAELLAEDLADWPDDAWLGFDDYQFAADSQESERFVDILVQKSPVRLLVTTRSRPAWATARRVLYGEIHELATHSLAMSQDEAAEVLAGRDQIGGIVALAEGWPAIIGIASLTAGLDDVPGARMPQSLYEYFAEELYQEADRELKGSLLKLALTPAITRDIARHLLGPVCDQVLSTAARLGFLIRANDDSFDMHPLLRSFLEEKLRELAEVDRLTIAATVVDALAEHGRWDDALSVSCHFCTQDVFMKCLESALPSMLKQGRLTTITGYLEVAMTRGETAPIVDLAEAEVTFREGQVARSETLALQAHSRLQDRPALAARAAILAGASALMGHRDEAALRHYTNARRLAESPEDSQQARWGAFLAAMALERPESAELLDDFASEVGNDPNRLVQLASGQLIVGIWREDLHSVGHLSRDWASLSRRADDPIIRTSFLHSCANALVMMGEYQEALSLAESQIADARATRLEFVLPHALMDGAAAALGKRDFSRCRHLLDLVEPTARERRAQFVLLNSLSIRARMHLALGSVEDARDSLEARPPLRSVASMEAEFRACEALVSAVAGDTAQAEKAAREAGSMSIRPEATALARWVLAIVGLMRDRAGAAGHVLEAFEAGAEGSIFDPFVTAYRAYPRLLSVVSDSPGTLPLLVDILGRANDDDLARSEGVRIPRPARPRSPEDLSPREKEVGSLVAQGLSNKEIARLLFISERTVKVHLHHIFEKLGARSRTEAALRFTEGRQL